jgi:actin-like ATPase involved in cell morphogenesis
MAIGFDAGTYNLVCCTRDDKKDFVYDREVNAFLEIALEDRLVFQMMKTVGVPLIERSNKAYALGEKAVRMAYTLAQLELKRPMKDGCVNSKERDAYEVMSIMLHSLLEGNVKSNNDILYFSVPANAINEETDAEFHTNILDSIFKAYESDEGYKVKAFPINEGLALVYAELKADNYTGIGISFGAGMVNLCFAMFGVPVFTFAIVNSGDWIDKMAAKATGESITFINQEKTKVNLSSNPANIIERAIQTQYRIMVEKTVTVIKKGLSEAGKKARSDKPVDIVIAGGTSLPVGFDTLFRDVIKQTELPIQVGKIVRPDDPLFSVARGCLVAAENSLQ